MASAASSGTRAKTTAAPGAPTGDWNYKSYQQYFVDMAAAWKQDYPNIKHYYVFQVWPLPCCMGPKDDYIREAQRTLPGSVLQFARHVHHRRGRRACRPRMVPFRSGRLCGSSPRFMSPLVEQDNYGPGPAAGGHRAEPQAGLVHPCGAR